MDEYNRLLTDLHREKSVYLLSSDFWMPWNYFKLRLPRRGLLELSHDEFCGPTLLLQEASLFWTLHSSREERQLIFDLFRERAAEY